MTQVFSYSSGDCQTMRLNAFFRSMVVIALFFTLLKATMFALIILKCCSSAKMQNNFFHTFFTYLHLFWPFLASISHVLNLYNLTCHLQWHRCPNLASGKISLNKFADILLMLFPSLPKILHHWGGQLTPTSSHTTQSPPFCVRVTSK